jgi:hypothetical protein
LATNTAHLFLVASGATITLPSASAVPAGTYYEIQATASGSPTFTLNSSSTIYIPSVANTGTTSISITQYVEVVSDGTAWYALGSGNS